MKKSTQSINHQSWRQRKIGVKAGPWTHILQPSSLEACTFTWHSLYANNLIYESNYCTCTHTANSGMWNPHLHVLPHNVIIPVKTKPRGILAYRCWKGSYQYSSQTLLGIRRWYNEGKHLQICSHLGNWGWTRREIFIQKGSASMRTSCLERWSYLCLWGVPQPG